MKKILMASVAAMAFAPAAFADVDADLEAVLNGIEAAYDALDGDVSAEAMDALEDLVYYADNHGAVSNIDFMSITPDSDGNFAIGSLVVQKHDFSTEIGTTRTALVDEMAEDFYGASNKGRADVAVTETSDVWAVSGLTSGLVHDYLEKTGGFVDALNALETDLNVTEFDADAISEINTEVQDLQDAADDFNASIDKASDAQDDAWIDSTETDLKDYTYAVRSGETVNIIDADDVVTAVVAEIEKTSAVEGYTSYADLVANYVTEASE